MTYLELVNSVLVRMRENTVTTVNETLYSSLIGQFVNDAKRRVEDAFDWNALANTITLNTVSGTYNYILSGTNNRFKVIDVMNTSTKYQMQNVPITWMTRQFLLTTPQTGSAYYYGFNGVDSSGNVKVDVYPIPNKVETINFNIVLPQNALSADTDVLLVPSDLVSLGAYAMAIAERGEDGSVTSGDAYGLYNSALSDAIAIENSRYVENSEWQVV